MALSVTILVAIGVMAGMMVLIHISEIHERRRWETAHKWHAEREDNRFHDQE
jgi:hypothetical protein